MADKFCECDQWQYYVKNYEEVFSWNDDYKKWYILWVKLSEDSGFTQVSRYAIPIHYCPCCGNELKNPKEGQLNVKRL